MRHLAVRSAVATAVVLCLGAAAALTHAQDLSEVEIETQDLGKGVHMLVGRGGNIGVSAGEDGVFLIDDQFPVLTEKIKAAVAKISDKPIKFVLNTHWHHDHTGGNDNLGKEGALIVAHENVRVRMNSAAFRQRMQRAPTEDELPVVTFTDTVTFHLNGDEIHAFHVPPAHTDGDSIVHFRKANVIHMGDLFFNRLYPFIDLSSGGSLDGVIAAAERTLKIVDDETKIIPGHGDLATKADLQTYADILKKIRERVAKLIAEGKTREEVIAAKPTAEWDDPWGKRFMKPPVFLGIVYDSLSKSR